MYSLPKCEEVDKELDRLISLGIIKSVQYSERAVTIVAVVKLTNQFNCVEITKGQSTNAQTLTSTPF